MICQLIIPSQYPFLDRSSPICLCDLLGLRRTSIRSSLADLTVSPASHLWRVSLMLIQSAFLLIRHQGIF